MKPCFSAILAVTKNGVIGSGGLMPWHMRSDLSRFRQLTSGSVVIMGRKTWESLPAPLKKRVNIVISRTLTKLPSNSQSPVILCRSLAEAKEISALEAAKLGKQEVFVIGGEQIYKQAAPYISKLYITIILALLAGDTHICPQDFPGTWICRFRQIIRKDTVDSYNSIFTIYEREA